PRRPRSAPRMRIYLDHNAGAPLRPEARDAMLAFLGAPANPSSAHREGARARSAVEAARAEVAALVGATPAEIVFTSGATEANNLALRGAGKAGALVTTAIEHASVLDTARALATAGRPVWARCTCAAASIWPRRSRAVRRSAAGAPGRRTSRASSASGWPPAWRAPSSSRPSRAPRRSSNGCGAASAHGFPR